MSCFRFFENYFKNEDSIIRTQRFFHRHFRISSHGKIPDRKTMSLWVTNFREAHKLNFSCLKPRIFKSPGRPRHVRTSRDAQRLIANEEKHLDGIIFRATKPRN